MGISHIYFYHNFFFQISKIWKSWMGISTFYFHPSDIKYNQHVFDNRKGMLVIHSVNTNNSLVILWRINDQKKRLIKILQKKCISKKIFFLLLCVSQVKYILWMFNKERKVLRPAPAHTTKKKEKKPFM